MTRSLLLISILCVSWLWNGHAHAAKIADITRISGQRTNVLTGLGLVFGLAGTGDGGDYLPAIQPLAAMLGNFNDPATVRDLGNVANVALVSITVTVPSHGVRNGDKLDVFVNSIGAAQSLRGGRLFVTPLTGPTPGSGIYALASGPITIEDESVLTSGRIVGGAVMEADLITRNVENGRFTLVIEDPSASWGTASAIAKIINDSEGDVGAAAFAVDPKNVVVNIPPAERERPDSFIARVQALPLPNIPTEARVQINEKQGTLIMTGDVEISPVVIIHRGLTISTMDPPPRPTPQNPLVTEHHVFPLDPANSGGAKLADLVNALDLLKVPADDRIEIVKELYKTGKLHAKLITE